MEGLLSPWHLLIVFVVAILVFGPSKLPEIGRQLGRGLSEFRKFRESLDDDLRGFLHHDEDEPSTSPPRELPPGDEHAPSTPPPRGLPPRQSPTD